MPETTAAKTTILVVDDVADNLILISLSLQDMDYRVLTANNGRRPSPLLCAPVQTLS